uniref:Uncharacterized protein n=1 Tax=Anopheles quadriannulatus TaxID=34691 RepID=A0A182XQD2_ANOQN
MSIDKPNRQRLSVYYASIRFTNGSNY